MVAFKCNETTITVDTDRAVGSVREMLMDRRLTDRITICHSVPQFVFMKAVLFS
jgi:hypothetical protein